MSAHRTFTDAELEAALEQPTIAEAARLLGVASGTVRYRAQCLGLYEPAPQPVHTEMRGILRCRSCGRTIRDHAVTEWCA